MCDITRLWSNETVSLSSCLSQSRRRTRHWRDESFHHQNQKKWSRDRKRSRDDDDGLFDVLSQNAPLLCVILLSVNLRIPSQPVKLQIFIYIYGLQLAAETFFSSCYTSWYGHSLKCTLINKRVFLRTHVVMTLPMRRFSVFCKTRKKTLF